MAVSGPSVSGEILLLLIFIAALHFIDIVLEEGLVEMDQVSSHSIGDLHFLKARQSAGTRLEAV